MVTRKYAVAAGPLGVGVRVALTLGVGVAVVADVGVGVAKDVVVADMGVGVATDVVVASGEVQPASSPTPTSTMVSQRIRMEAILTAAASGLSTASSVGGRRCGGRSPGLV